MNGYYGALCNRRCPIGYYGQMCTMKCQCSNGLRCDASNGECTKQCPAGFTGDNCQSRMHFYTNIVHMRIVFLDRNHIICLSFVLSSR